MKTLKVEAVYLMDYDTFEDVAASTLHRRGLQQSLILDSALGYLSPAQFKDYHARPTVKTAA